MKHTWIIRVLACLLVCLTLASCAAAEGIDLSALSDDEVIALLAEVNAEVVSRGIEKTATLPKGTYIAGKDIPVGSYVYTCLAQGSDWGNVTVRADEGAGKQLLWEVVGAPKNGEAQDTVFMSLKEGDELKSGVPFSLTIAVGVLFK